MTTEDLQEQTLEGLLTLEYLLLQIKKSCTIDIAGAKLLEHIWQTTQWMITLNQVQNQTNDEPERA